MRALLHAGPTANAYITWSWAIQGSADGLWHKETKEAKSVDR